MTAPIPKRGLGHKTLALIFLKYSGGAVLLIIGIVIALTSSRFVSPDLAARAETIGTGMAMLGVIAIIGVFSLAWLEYSHYTIALDDSTFRTTHGVLDIEELGFPYRHIHQAKIMRSLADQLLGVSTLVVLVSGENVEHEEEIVLPWLDKTLAASIQDALLKKSEIEQMHIASSAI
jgi:uncharacterized membrane protein YdbT with pleckstrin-like domain